MKSKTPLSHFEAPSVQPNVGPKQAVGGPSMADAARLPLTTLKYDVQSWSSYAPPYHPKTILANDPNNQASRWTSANSNQSQFIVLKLDKMAVVKTIGFGKYYKVHVCNLKEFKVYAGLTLSTMVEVLHAGLRNDADSETFALKWRWGDVAQPCQFIKIVPLLPWGPNFNFSVWFVELKGIGQPDAVRDLYWAYMHHREHEAIRLMLKHFRQRNLLDSFSALSHRTNVTLEDALLSTLHASLVVNGSFETAETLLADAEQRGHFDEYISTKCNYQPAWRKLVTEEKPTARGGHQMCIDAIDGKIYIFGGWDGSKDLSDFWAFDQVNEMWLCLSTDTRRNNGPGPRSCHKMVFDPKSKSIYVLGRYVDQDSRPNMNLDNDFFRYDIINNKWIRISSNTFSEGGPELIYDHQMVLDAEGQVLYVYGGKTIDPDTSQMKYSGLYAYYIDTGRWRLIMSDATQKEGEIQLRSRIGHSMIFNPRARELYIFAGQRYKDYLADFYSYNIDDETVTEISRDYNKSGGPDAGFTQRATIDIELGEIYVMNGLIKEKNQNEESVKNAFWAYNISRDSWTKVYHNENTGSEYWNRMVDSEPCPRFAHQMAYDDIRKTQYLHGGNPGEKSDLKTRLDDFWELKLKKIDSRDVLRKARFLVKKQKFREMCHSQAPTLALRYLQTELSDVVDHHDDTQSKEFRELTQWLFQWNPSGAKGLASAYEYDPYTHRMQLYEEIINFFPMSMREPCTNLVDLVAL